jgi:D-beta-D-heptose 7-phosphate kinase/D-beta-D-heptose 1-phosphate adenosyltransferase
VPATVTATVQECHTVALHLLCAAIDGALEPAVPERTAGRPGPRPATTPARGAPGVPRPVAVVGDVVLDQDLAGEVRRISPEAPVPVVDEVTARYRPGGAGLAALLAARSGCDVILVTAMSQDGPGRRLAAMLRDAGIQIIDLGRAGPTPVKTRVRADGRTMIMLSEAPGEPGPVSRPLTGAERDLVLGAGAVLVSDYGGGIAGLPGVRSVLTAAAGRVPVVWDVRYGGADPVPGVRLVTPNVRTAAQLAAAVSGDGLGPDIDRGRLLLSSWSAVSVAVTRGSQGAVLLDGQEALPLVIPAPAASAGDSCGAGDCFAATAASRLAGGALVSEAVTAAVATASAFVAAGGAAALGRPEGQPPAAESAGDARTRVRAAGGTVVATSGCFDLLHSGHVAMLRQARSLGDWLVVCLNDDDSVRRLKGADRPIVPAADRAAVLLALASVDDVVIFGENRPDDALRQIRPDIYVKGGDYRIGDVLEAQLVASWNGRTVIVPYVERWSTTKVINEVIQRARPAG